VTSKATLAVLMALSAVTVATVLGWSLVALASRFVPRASWPARSRATLLAQVRLLPLMCTVLLVSAQVHAFLEFETSRAESAGPLLFLLAGIGLALLLDGSSRAIQLCRTTAATIARWRSTAIPLAFSNWRGPVWAIRPVFPVVAVAGAFRPRLFVARQVLHRCTKDEMAAILAHEAAHVAARDNLVQLLFVLTPGARIFAKLATSIEAEWRAATEEAADNAASAETDPLHLAAALTKVARLAIVAAPRGVTASALISATDFDMRVRRLVDSAPAPRRRHSAWLPSVALIVTAVISQLPAVAAGVHEVFELLVRSR
jgi:Zn-dependent protease with chaperone function